MKKRLLILSDIYGLHQNDWLNHYTDKLKNDFEIVVWDSRVLAGIPAELEDIEQVHRLFVSGGIASAVGNLIQSDEKPDLILGFSIGGTIAWQVAAQNPKLSQLFLISSTRLRKETNRIAIPFELFYGTEDNYKPTPEWFAKMECVPHLLKNEGHEFYKKEVFAKKIVEEIRKFA